MRAFGFRVNGPNLHQPPTPGSRTAAMSAQRRRLDDAMVAVFERACSSNDLDAAADVLALLEKWHERRAAKYGRERRIDDRALEIARAELVRLTALRKV